MPNNRTLAFGLGAIALLLIGVGIGSVAQSRNTPAASINTTMSPQRKEPTATPSDAISPTPASAEENSSPTSPAQQEANIIVTSPTMNATVGSHFSVTGQARVFENTFQVRVTNTTTKAVVFNKTAATDAKDAGLFGNFSVPVTLSTTATKSGDKLLVEVFQFSAKDGSEVDKVTRTVIYQ